MAMQERRRRLTVWDPTPSTVGIGLRLHVSRRANDNTRDEVRALGDLMAAMQRKMGTMRKRGVPATA